MSKDLILAKDLTGLSKPATALIDKISEAIGGVFKPWQIRRVAEAEAEADKIKAVSRIKITELQQRALHRFFYEEAKKQSNIEKITAQSLPQLDKKAKPENIEEDWITNFFDKCRLISDEKMQTLWSRILAGEANAPGKFSRRTVSFMATLDKRDAVLLTKLCSFNWMLGDTQPLIYDLKEKLYTKNSINFGVLKHLDAIGLISFETLMGYKKIDLPQKFKVMYQNTPFILEFPKEKENELKIGQVLLTSIGRELVTICESSKIAGFDKYIVEQWTKIGIKVTRAKSSPDTV